MVQNVFEVYLKLSSYTRLELFSNFTHIVLIFFSKYSQIIRSFLILFSNFSNNSSNHFQIVLNLFVYYFQTVLISLSNCSQTIYSSHIVQTVLKLLNFVSNSSHIVQTIVLSFYLNCTPIIQIVSKPFLN